MRSARLCKNSRSDIADVFVVCCEQPAAAEQVRSAPAVRSEVQGAVHDMRSARLCDTARSVRANVLIVRGEHSVAA